MAQDEWFRPCGVDVEEEDVVRLDQGKLFVTHLGSEVPTWIAVCGVDDIDSEDVIRFDHEGGTYAIYRSADDRYFATDGLCTHEKVHLTDGFVMDDLIECPKHNGLFNYMTGEARGAPVCINLTTYATKVESGTVFVAFN